MLRVALLLSSFLLSLAISSAQSHYPNCTVAPLKGSPLCDETLPYLTRAKWIVSQMTMAEKAARLQNGSPAIPRLGLPAYEWWSEALHGVAYSPGVSYDASGNFSCVTSFPEPIGLGATFDRQLIRNVAATTSDEARALNNHGNDPTATGAKAGLDFWTPNINIFRDPRSVALFCDYVVVSNMGWFARDILSGKDTQSEHSSVHMSLSLCVCLCLLSLTFSWGRGQETPGEDTYLSSEYVFYLITGYQVGEDARYYKIVADCKHYAGYDVEHWHNIDRYSYNAIISNQDLVETYLPSFKSCLKDAHVGSAMCSYNAVNGVPACANNMLMNEIARGRWGWDGWITSDCGAVSGIYDGHHYVSNHSAQVQVALQSGCDIGCDGALSEYAEQAVKESQVAESDVDLALIRQFSSLVRLGYFDDATNQPYRHYGAEKMHTTAATALSHLAARESLVLLKNDGTLPYDASKIGHAVAVIGPNANSAGSQIGNYNGKACFMTTPYAGISKLATASYDKGCEINSTDTSGFASALNAAKNADIIVFVGGLDNSLEAEGHDRDTIELPGLQPALIAQLSALGKPLVLVLLGGGGVDVSAQAKDKNVNAIFWHGYPSQAGGDALAEALFGQFSPAGRLPVTWYPAQYTNTVPLTDQSMRADKQTGKPGRTYKFYAFESVFPFGYGLSYTNFQYDTVSEPTTILYTHQLIQEARLDEREATAATWTVKVTNTGKTVSDIVVLGFISSSATTPGVTPPIKELYDYQRVHSLAPGSSQIITLGLSYRVLSSIDVEGHAWLLPGVYRLFIQDNDLVHETSVTIAGEPQLIEDSPVLQRKIKPAYPVAAVKTPAQSVHIAQY